MRENNQKEIDKINYPDKIEKIITFDITAGQKPERLDCFLSRMITNATRNKVQTAIEEGKVEVNGKIAKSSQKIKPADKIICTILKLPPIELVPENIPLNIVFEDEYLMVINKPAYMPVHPGFGNRVGTLVNALLYHFGERQTIKVELADDEEDAIEGEIFASSAVRPGIAHRLDKDTSGLLVIGKNTEVLSQLSKQFADRTVDRNYYSIVWGKFENPSGSIEANLARSKRDRKIFETVKSGGKTARTDYEVIENYDYLSLLKLKLHTGRTHQIRVHLKSLNRPVFGDIAYGGDRINFGGENSTFKKWAEKAVKKLNRQALHAKTLGFTHPITNERLFFESELPQDMIDIINRLKQGFQ